MAARKKQCDLRYEANYEDHGCGFRVVIDRVPIYTLGPDEIPWINLNMLGGAVLKALADKPTRLTGKEVRFIRIHYEMRLAEFGDMLDVTHAAVKKWENRQDSATGMAWSTEVMIRLFVLRKVKVKLRAFQQAYDRLVLPRPTGTLTLHVDLDRDPVETRYESGALAEAS